MHRLTTSGCLQFYAVAHRIVSGRITFKGFGGTINRTVFNMRQASEVDFWNEDR